MLQERFSLASIKRLTGFTAPAFHRPGQTSARFRSTIKALARNGGNPLALMAVKKAKFTKALRQIGYYVRALQALVKAVGADECEALSSVVDLTRSSADTRLLEAALGQP